MTATHSARASAAASGATREHPAGEGHDRLAAAEAGEEREGVADHGRRHGGVAGPRPAEREPDQPGQRCPSARRRAKAGQARRAPSCSSAFQAPGLPSPVRAQVDAVAAADEQGDGTDPSR